MVGLIICTHGKLSEGLVDAAEMMLGKQENTAYITFETGESSGGLVRKYEECLKSLDAKDGILFMVDMFGGSPYNAASRIAACNKNMDIVTGVNLPMLLEVNVARTTLGISDLVNTAVCAGSAAIKAFRTNFIDNIEEEL